MMGDEIVRVTGRKTAAGRLCVTAKKPHRIPPIMPSGRKVSHITNHMNPVIRQVIEQLLVRGEDIMHIGINERIGGEFHDINKVRRGISRESEIL